MWRKLQYLLEQLREIPHIVVTNHEFRKEISNSCAKKRLNKKRDLPTFHIVHDYVQPLGGPLFLPFLPAPHGNAVPGTSPLCGWSGRITWQMEKDIRAAQIRVFSENLNRPYEAYFPMSELQSDLSFIIHITAYITAMHSEVVHLGLTVRGHVICYLIKRLAQKFSPSSPTLYLQ